MNTITVDDERFAVTSLLRLLKKIDPQGVHKGALYPEDFMKYVTTHDIDVAFIDVDLYDVNGIELTKKLAEIKPELNVIMYTGHPEFKAEALDLFVSGYLVKPVNEADLVKALAHLRYPVKKHKKTSALRVQCFGSFAAFKDDKPIVFGKAKSLELLAFLVYKKGAAVTMNEIHSILWEDKPVTPSSSSYLRQIISELRLKLREFDAEDIIIKKRNSISIDISQLECDWYEYSDGNLEIAYSGEFMEQYVWAENVKAFLK